MRITILFLALLGASLTGCQSVIEAMGYTVVDEELQQVDNARDEATQKYVAQTLPLLAKGFEGEALLEAKDLGETLQRVSALENRLINGGE